MYGIPVQSPYSKGAAVIGKFFVALGALAGGTAGVIAFIVALALLRGYVLSQLWGWFVQPLGAPHIGVVHAIGLSLAAQTFLPMPSSEGKVKGGLLFPLLILLLGYIVHLYM
jgi:hypothetical protein